MDQPGVHAEVTAEQEPDISPVFELCAHEMSAIDTLIRDSLDSNVVLIRQIAEYIIGSGGKRLRPMLVILSTRACGYEGGHHINLAAIIEFIHTATLLHDDVVDESGLRRGKESAHAVWGNAASVLVGDFLYSRSFQMMVKVDSRKSTGSVTSALSRKRQPSCLRRPVNSVRYWPGGLNSSQPWQNSAANWARLSR